MSKRRASSKRRKGKVPPHLRRYLFKKKGRKTRSRKRHGKVQHMAKRRRKSHSKRRHHTARRRSRRGGGGGGRAGWVPPREDLHLFAAAGAIGFLESQAAADATHILNRLPRPIAQLGYTGGTAIAAWVVAKLTGNRWARLLARGAASAAAYQMGRHGGMFADSSHAVQMSGEDYLSGGEEHMIEDHMMGALESEGSMSGEAFDDAVHHAGSY
jgi:hypothetical protein